VHGAGSSAAGAGAAWAGSSGHNGVVVHIPDPSSGVIHVMRGTSEFVHTDSALAAQLAHMAR
jgi:hypothetical protein